MDLPFVAVGDLHNGPRILEIDELLTIDPGERLDLIPVQQVADRTRCRVPGVIPAFVGDERHRIAQIGTLVPDHMVHMPARLVGDRLYQRALIG